VTIIAMKKSIATLVYDQIAVFACIVAYLTFEGGAVVIGTVETFELRRPVEKFDG